MRSGTRLSLLVGIAALAGCSASGMANGPCEFPTASMTDWRTHDEGGFTIQLPTEFTRAETQGIDSQVGLWEAPGKRVSYDLGFYSNTLQPNDLTPFPGLRVCQEGTGDQTPRIILYRPADGGYAVAAHWEGVRQDPTGQAIGLTIEGHVERADDQGEILQIIKSVQVPSP